MVLGPDPEKQLAPYHEYECTGDDNEFVVNVDITEDVKKRMSDGESLEEALGYHGLEERIVAREEDVLTVGGCHKKKYAYGYAVVVDGALVKAIDRTNPNAKWDWYVLGGRFGGTILRKKGGPADQCPLYDVDVEGMRNEAEGRWRARYRKYVALTAGCPAGQTWKAIREKHGDDKIAAARDEYGAQPIVAAFRSDRDHTFAFGDDPIEEFACTEDEYAGRARAQALATFAVVKDGKWHERGEMGWFACVSNEKDEGDWNQQVSNLLDGLPGDTLVSIYDCHI